MDTYSFLRQFSDSWGLLAMVLFFGGVILYALRPGAKAKSAPRTGRSARASSRDSTPNTSNRNHPKPRAAPTWPREKATHARL